MCPFSCLTHTQKGHSGMLSSVLLKVCIGTSLLVISGRLRNVPARVTLLFRLCIHCWPKESRAVVGLGASHAHTT